MELKGLQRMRHELVEKLNFFREEYAVVSDFEKKFELKKRIEQIERELVEVDKKIANLTHLNVSQGQNSLKEKISQLGMDTVMGELHLVNCDRQEVADAFWDAFDRKTDTFFQYYFILADRQQMPPSLAERMVYELIHDELDDELEAIDCKRRPNTNRLDVEYLQMKNNLLRTQKLFVKELARRFARFPNFDLLNFTKKGIPQMQEKYVVNIFVLDSLNWREEFTAAFFQWIMDTFKQVDEDSPRFLFFFVIYLDNFYDIPNDRQQKKIYNSISNLVANNETACTILVRLFPVDKRFLEAWISSLGEQNPNKIEEVIATMVNGLSEEKQRQYKENQTFDMADIEQLQELFYELNLRKV